MSKRWLFSLVPVSVLVGTALLLSACAKPEPPKEIPITTKSEEARQLFLQARDRVEKNELDEARRLLDQAIQKDPEFAMAYLLKASTGGGFNVRRENREKANALAGNVTQGERLMIKYSLAVGDGNTARQKVFLDSLLLLFPLDKRVKGLAGIYYERISDHKTALNYYTQAVQIDSNYAPAYNTIGYASMEAGDYAGAEQAFKTYIRLNPNNPNPYDSFAEFLMKRGRYDESIEQYKKALEKDPTFYSSLLGIGDNYTFKGEYAKGREYYDMYIEKGTEIEAKFAGLQQKAFSYVYEGKIPDAIKTFEERRSLAEKEKVMTAAIYSIASQAFVLTECGKPSDGLKKYEEAANAAKSAELPEAIRENLMVTSNLWLTFACAENKKLDKAKEYADVAKKEIERRANPDELNNLASMLGYLYIKQGDYDKGLARLSKVAPGPLELYYMGFAYFKKGDKGSAKKIAEQIANWNQNSIFLAVYRKRAMSEFGK